MGTKTKQLAFQIDEEQFSRLVKDTGCTSRVDLMNNALTFFEHAMEISRKGETLASINPEKTRYKEITMKPLELARQKAKVIVPFPAQ